VAEFCRQCTIEDGLPGGNYEEGRGDLQGVTSHSDWEQGLAVVVICEGCGPIQVDPEGNCVSEDCLRHHGLRPPPP
jgi:hypothetical protein